jgi:hypothetical protein
MSEEVEVFEVCEFCGKKFSVTKGEISFQEDPFASEINDDHTEAWQCESCSSDSAMEI